MQIYDILLNTYATGIFFKFLKFAFSSCALSVTLFKVTSKDRINYYLLLLLISNKQPILSVKTVLRYYLKMHLMIKVLKGLFKRQMKEPLVQSCPLKLDSH